MSAFTILSVSCTKPTDDDPIIPPTEGFITINQINGIWKTIAYVYDGTRYKYVTPTSNPTQVEINKLFRTFTFYSTTKVVDYTWTSTGNSSTYDITKSTNHVEFLENSIVKEKYDVISFSNDTLRLSFTYKYGNSTLKTGTYILHK